MLEEAAQKRLHDMRRSATIRDLVEDLQIPGELREIGNAIAADPPPEAYARKFLAQQLHELADRVSSRLICVYEKADQNKRRRK